MVNKQLCLLIVLFIFFLNSCSSPEKITQLYGTYIVDYEIAKEKLTLKDDGTFIQEVTLKSTSKLDVAHGSWSYNKETGYITFHENFFVVLDGYKKFNPNYAHPKKGNADLPVYIIFGTPRIEYNEEITYKKIS